MQTAAMPVAIDVQHTEHFFDLTRFLFDQNSKTYLAYRGTRGRYIYLIPTPCRV